MLRKSGLIEDIRLGFAVLQNYVRPGGSLNLTDVNIQAEDFVKDILNASYDWHLTNTNTSRANYPCIDLIDTTNRIGVQVSSDTSGPKINETISCLKTHKLDQQIIQLKCFTLLPKQGTYKINSICPNVNFNWKLYILDFNDMLSYAQRVENIVTLERIHNQVVYSLPSYFSSRDTSLRELRDRVENSLREFDREVMSAPFQYEDPVRMCKSIMEMRINLQKQGASHIANKVVGDSFQKAHLILRDCERSVRDRYPHVYKAAMTFLQPGILPHVDYQDGEYGNCIALMMEIRNKLQPLLNDIEVELQSIVERIT